MTPGPALPSAMNVLSDGTAITLSQSRPLYTVCVHRTLARRGDTFLSHDRPTEWRCRAHDGRERPTTCRPRSPDLAPRGRSSTAGSAKSTASAVFERQSQALTLRNRVIRVVLVTLFLILVLFFIVAGARLQWSPQTGTTKATSFPSARLTLLCVILFGFIGGLISALPVLGRPPTSPDPYGLAIYQAALKLPVGGVLAVIGCVALQSATLPGVTGVTTLGGLLFWAAAFGASQQAVTRLLDAQVGNLLRTPGQSTLPRQPTPTLDLGLPTADSTPSEQPGQTYERGHTVNSVQTTPFQQLWRITVETAANERDSKPELSSARGRIFEIGEH